MDFKIIPRNDRAPSSGFNTAYLTIDRWNDYSFVTMFYLSLHDDKGELHELGNVKIGFQGQTEEKSTHSILGNTFSQLSSEFFSLGQDVDYYKKISMLPYEISQSLLEALNDIVYKPALLDLNKDEEVFGTSLLRNVSLSVIRGQYSRVLAGHPPLTNFEFKFSRPEINNISSIELTFKVKVESKPSTNIHALIGRNGVGKTTILNDMIEAITTQGQYAAKFYDTEGWGQSPISNEYFSSLVSVSFSAFDPFEPPKEQTDPSLGTCYSYIGLKKEGGTLKEIDDIHQDFIKALKACFGQTSKKERWLTAITTLESDENFERMALKEILDFPSEVAISKAQEIIQEMSSGHAVVLFTITRLVAAVEEKTLVIIDEPESHLHPPLLSAFIRALSELLHDRNGVAIIATHSPVVIQEIPKSCAWKINRVDLVTEAKRPEVETFGENVGVLTREVFGLEVVKSGFHDLLVKSVESGLSYEQISSEYDDQLGLEARALLKVLVTHRDRSTDIV
jgi:predicted ATPase